MLFVTIYYKKIKDSDFIMASDYGTYEVTTSNSNTAAPIYIDDPSGTGMVIGKGLAEGLKNGTRIEVTSISYKAIKSSSGGTGVSLDFATYSDSKGVKVYIPVKYIKAVTMSSQTPDYSPAAQSQSSNSYLYPPGYTPTPQEILEANLSGTEKDAVEYTWDFLNSSSASTEDKETMEDKAFKSTTMFGAPPQFTKYSDPRYDGSKIGRKYMSSIVTNPTVISICPGKSRYLPFLSTVQKTSVTNAINGLMDGSLARDQLNGIIDSSGSFFTFQSDYGTYMQYVNLLCRVAAIYMGIGNRHFHGNSNYPIYSTFDWGRYYSNQYTSDSTNSADKVTPGSFSSNFLNSIFSFREIAEGISGENQYVHFYGTTQTSYSDDINTSVRPSTIESALEQKMDDMIKDFMFATNGLMGEVGTSLGKSIGDLLTSFNTNDGGPLGFIGSLVGKIGRYFTGARLIFPQIVDDVTYGKSISVGVKLVSPYGDVESRYLHIIVPLMHLLAMALPKQVDQDLYTFPFLVRAFCKGLFNCDMGVISDLRINRGGDDNPADLHYE
jgi:hypothetical protein